MAAEGRRNKPSKPVEGRAKCPPEAGNSGHDAEPPAAEEVDADLPDGLSPREAAAVEALLQQPTIARAATSVGINERTLRRWIAGPVFRRALLEARRASFGQAIGMMQSYAAVAASSLIKIAQQDSATASARVAAAAVLLKFGREGIELEDLADRIHLLEQTMKPSIPDLRGKETAEASDEDAEPA